MEKSIKSNIPAPTKSDGRVEYAFFMECHRRGHDFDIRGKNIRTTLAKGGSVQERSQMVLVVAYAQDLVHARSRRVGAVPCSRDPPPPPGPSTGTQIQESIGRGPTPAVAFVHKNQINWG